MSKNKVEDCAIVVPGNGEYEGPWRITYPFLKLSLKYGYRIGTWSPNWSLEFDRYAAGRGPKQGLPNLADFAVTALMNSRVRATDMKTLGAWLAVPENIERLESVRKTLAATRDLASLSKKGVVHLGRLVDDMIYGRELQGVRMAKVMKWLAAWAPAHVPMVDRHVYRAMTGNARLGAVPMADVIARFQRLLIAHDQPLRRLQQFLAQRLDVPVATITPVRVLDSLMWFDWWAIYAYAPQFQRWIAPNNAARARAHLARAEAEEWAASEGLM